MSRLIQLRKNWVKSYLGGYFKKPQVGTINQLKDCDVEGKYFIKSHDFMGSISYLLMKQGRQNYRVISSSQVIDIYLGKNLEVDSYKDLVDRVLFVLVDSFEMTNQRRWELIYQLAFERSLSNLGLIIIYDAVCSCSIQLETLGFISVGEFGSKQNKKKEDF